MPDAVTITLAAAVAAAIALGARARAGQARQRAARLAAERELAELRAERVLLERRLVSQEKLTSLGMLAASVAHEISNPMSYVTANVRGLQDALAALPELPASLREHATEVLPDTLDGIARVNAIVADLRGFAREDRGPGAEFDLNAQVETALRIAQGHLRHRVAVVRSLGRLPPAFGHARQISQVLVNLLVNGAQAIGERGTLWVTTRADPDDLTVEVRDDGAGMAPEVLERLFQPFFTTKAQGAGTGLGLAVAHGIVRAHGGRIAVESAPGQGSTFRVHLPRRSPLARRAAREGPEAPPAAGGGAAETSPWLHARASRAG